MLKGKMLNWDSIVKEYSQTAIKELDKEYLRLDAPMLKVMKEQAGIPRAERMKKWLGNYRVLQGFDNQLRAKLSETVIAYLDNLAVGRGRLSDSKMVELHGNLMAECAKAYNRNRSFVSLASKALWLRFPDQFPMYDRNAKNALMLLSKLDLNLPALNEEKSSYAEFVHAWRHFYDQTDFNHLIPVECPYKVRIFDRLLWILGDSTYRREK